MKQGRLGPQDTAQIAIWICDEDNPAKIAWWKKEEVPRRMKDAADSNGAVLGPIRWAEFWPGEDQAGHPPAGTMGSNVRLLVAEADVKDWKEPAAGYRFSQDISPADLAMLREATKRAYNDPDMKNETCDKIIDIHGPQVMEKHLAEKAKRNGGL